MGGKLFFHASIKYTTSPSGCNPAYYHAACLNHKMVQPCYTEGRNDLFKAYPILHLKKRPTLIRLAIQKI